VKAPDFLLYLRHSQLMNLLKRTSTSISLIVICAFAIRILVFWTLQIHARVPVAANQPFGYETGSIARSIAEGKGFSSPLGVETGPTVWLTPAYPYLLAGVFKIWGVYTYRSLMAIVSLDAIFSALTCIPIFYVGKRLAGNVVGACAAWYWVIHPNAVIISLKWIWDTSLATLAAALILWATLAIADSKHLKDWIGYGLLWGVGLMVNAAIFALAPFLFLWLALRVRKQSLGHTWLKLPAVALIFMGVVCMPWTVRNYVVFQRVIPFRSNLGLELWLGNNDQVPDTWSPDLHPNDYAPEREKYVRLGEIEYMRQKQSEAIQFMESHPQDTMRFFWRRFADNWMGTWEPIQDSWGKMSLLNRSYFVLNISLSLFSLLGVLFMYREKNQYAFPLATFPLIYPIVYYVTHTSPRYRHPIDPVLVILATFALAYPIRALIQRRNSATFTVDTPGPKRNAETAPLV
jgi:hypothetical protein